VDPVAGGENRWPRGGPMTAKTIVGDALFAAGGKAGANCAMERQARCSGMHKAGPFVSTLQRL
jgi:hypothetical protein